MANIRHKGQTTRAMTRAGGGAPCCEEGERRAHFARGREVGEGARVGEGALFADARTQTREDGARAAREDRAARERPPRRARGARRAVRLGRGAISRAPARRAHPQRHKRHRGSHLQKRREEGNRVLAGPPEDLGSPDPEGAPFWIFPAPCYISTGGSCGVAWTPLLVPPPPICPGTVAPSGPAASPVRRAFCVLQLMPPSVCPCCRRHGRRGRSAPRWRQRSRRRDAPRGGLRAPLECMGPLWLCPVAPRLLPSLLDVVTRRT